MDISKYGLFLENLAYSKSLNESCDMQTPDGLKKVMSGEQGGPYTNQWNQLVDNMEANKSKDGTYIVIIKHDNGKDMISLNYDVKGSAVQWDPVLTPGVSATSPAAGKPATTPAAGQPTSKPAVPAGSLTPEQMDASCLDISKKVVERFNNKAAFSRWKGNFDDDEAGAWKDGFKVWYTTYLKKQVEAIRSSSKTITDPDAKARIEGNIETLDSIFNDNGAFYKKFMGGTGDDTFIWTINCADKDQQFSVDVDF